MYRRSSMRQIRRYALLVIAALAVLTLSSAFFALAKPAPQATGYHLLKKVALGGEGGWDYLTADSATHRLFISRGTHIMVVDADGKVVGDISNLKGTHG